jgi:hypothetical protein
MAVKYVKCPQNIPTSSAKRPSKIYPNLDYWFWKYTIWQPRNWACSTHAYLALIFFPFSFLTNDFLAYFPCSKTFPKKEKGNERKSLVKPEGSMLHRYDHYFLAIFTDFRREKLAFFL